MLFETDWGSMVYWALTPERRMEVATAAVVEVFIVMCVVRSRVD